MNPQKEILWVWIWIWKQKWGSIKLIIFLCWKFLFQRCQSDANLLQSSSPSLVRIRAASNSIYSASNAGMVQVGRWNFSQDYTQMLSAFISCLFEIGLFLSNEKMREVNKHRESHKWGKHLSMKEATEI